MRYKLQKVQQAIPNSLSSYGSAGAANMAHGVYSTQSHGLHTGHSCLNL